MRNGPPTTETFQPISSSFKEEEEEEAEDICIIKSKDFSPCSTPKSFGNVTSFDANDDENEEEEDKESSLLFFSPPRWDHRSSSTNSSPLTNSYQTSEFVYDPYVSYDWES